VPFPIYSLTLILFIIYTCQSTYLGLTEGNNLKNLLSLAVICAYLEGDLARIRLSILVGSLVPLVSLLVWDDIALGLAATDLAGFDVLDMLKTE